MKLDLYTRIILSILAACAVLLVAQSFGIGEDSAAAGPGQGQYRVAMAGGNAFRIDSESGRAWRMPLRGGFQWLEIREPDLELEEDDEDVWEEDQSGDEKSPESDE